MKTMIAAAVLLALSAPAFAGQKDIEELAEYTGLTERQVQMLIGPHSPYYEYKVGYNRAYRQFIARIGQENYQRLLDRQTVVLWKVDADRAVAVTEPAR